MKITESRLRELVIEALGPTMEEIVKEMGMEDTGTKDRKSVV